MEKYGVCLLYRYRLSDRLTSLIRLEIVCTGTNICREICDIRQGKKLAVTPATVTVASVLCRFLLAQKEVHEEEMSQGGDAMKMKQFVSAFLAVAMILGCLGWGPASAQQAQTDATQNNALSSAQPDDLTKDSQILDYVDPEQFYSAEHIARLSNEESLDNYVFLNSDGSKSIYYMGRPVKYIDDDGTIREKDITLVRKNNGYGMRDNDVTLYIPDAAATGVMLSHNDFAVRLTPQGGSGMAQQEENSIVYANYFGWGTFLRYTPMLSGMKEDIILAKYTGQNSFTFLLETNGLYLYQNEGSYYLAENQDAEAAFYLGQIEVYDAIGRPDLGTMTAETLVSGQRYRLTVSVDQAFLTDPETVYPVTIDPTLTVRDSADVTNTLADTPVFSNRPNKNYGDYRYDSIGYVEGYGTAMTAVRLTSLLADTNYSQLTAEQLTNVTFYIKGAGGQYANISAHALTENSTWTELGLTWNTLGAYSTNAYATVLMGGSSWNAFDLTDLAKEWKAGTQNPQCGFVLISDSSTIATSAYGGENPTVDYRPYVVATYTNQITLNQTSVAIYDGDILALTATTIPAGQAVTWESDTPAIASVSENGVVTGHAAGTAKITASLADGTTAECEIEVMAKTIRLNYNTSDNRAVVYRGSTVVVTADTDPANQIVTWVSDAPTVASVSESGLVTGHAVGTAKIRASLADGTAAECEIEVIAKTISLDYNTSDNHAVVFKGGAVIVTATTAPTGEMVTWSSLNPSVATVENGVIIGHNVGTATIMATLGDGTYAMCLVDVQPKGVSLNRLNAIVYVGGIETLIATTAPYGEVVEWTSAHPNIATVSAYGIVRGIAVGKTIIRATLDDGTYAECMVEIKRKSIHLNHTSIEIPVGESYLFEVETDPGGLEVYWYSRNTSVATVSPDGEVVGIAPGEASIVVSIADGTFVTCIVQVLEKGVIIEGDCTSVLEAGTLNLRARTIPANLPVMWASSDESIASVNTTGVVSGIKAGEVTITATTSDGLSASYTVYVIIQDGVYYLRSLHSGGYLHVTNGGIADFTDVCQYYKYSSTASDVVRIRQMWKICYLGDGRYSIRPMNKLDMGLDITFGDVDIYKIGTSDTLLGVPSYAEWTIECYDYGYVLKNDGLDQHTLQLGSGSAGMSATVIAGDYSAALLCRWELTKVNTPPTGTYLFDTSEKVVLLNATRSIDVGSSKSLTALNLSAIAFGETNIPVFSWESSDETVATVDDDGTVTGVGTGTATITGYVYLDNSYYNVSFTICIGFPAFFSVLINSNILTLSELYYTEDGLFLSTTPLSTMLVNKGITHIVTNADATNVWNVEDYFDDWYLFSVKCGTTVSYGLYKMREQEFDKIDGDDPGVTISFVSLDCTTLINCFSNNSTANEYALYEALTKVTGPGSYEADDNITSYFADTATIGAYIIAEEYVSFITNSVDGNVIDAPNNLKAIFSEIEVINQSLDNNFLDSTTRMLLLSNKAKLQRIPYALEAINIAAGRIIFDFNEYTITVQDKNSLTLYEQQAILACFTANVSYNSFAAEVEFHADAVYSWQSNIPWVGDKWYEAALRADMLIGEEHESGFYDDYYDLDNTIVKAQANVHGVK